MNEDFELDMLAMKKVFKQELLALDKYQIIAQNITIPSQELWQNYLDLLHDYRLLLQDAMKITAIGDINQKKLYDAFEELERQRSILYQSSITDYLTEVHNRSYVITMFEQIFLDARHYGQALSCILLDIDDFKNINDTYGHLIGDEVLKAIAQQIAHQLRKTDLIGRYGGEEFLIVLPSSNLTEATKVAEKIRLAVEQLKISKDHLSVTVSVGVCDNQLGSLLSPHAMLHKADLALYEAKNGGKNRVIAWK